MYAHFQALTPDKQQRIIQAALREFGRFGYQKTSAEQIAKSAGIAKGMVFHYFGNKQGLYEYIFAYSSDFMQLHFGCLEEQVANLDFIEQYRRITKIKLNAYTENPDVFALFAMGLAHPENLDVSPKIKNSFEKTTALRNVTFAMLSTTANDSCFRNDLDTAKAKKYIMWLVEGYSQNLLALIKDKPLADIDIDPFWDEFDEILDDMKKLFYK